MATINSLSATDIVTAGDLVAVYKQSNGDARKAAMSVLLAYMQDSLTFETNEFTKQYAAPAATGFSVAVTDGSNNIWLIMTPVAGYAAGTIVLPSTANAVDLQEILVICTQAVTALTIDGNGATDVIGEPTTLAANDYFRLKYDATTTTWYRIG